MTAVKQLLTFAACKKRNFETASECPRTETRKLNYCNNYSNFESGNISTLRTYFLSFFILVVYDSRTRVHVMDTLR